MSPIGLLSFAIECDLHPVIHSDDRPLLICAKNFRSQVSKTTERFFVGMTVHIALAAGNDHVFRVCFPQKVVAVGCAASVMSRLQQIRFQILSHFDHFLFRRASRIAREQHAGFSVPHLQADGIVISVIVFLIRSEKLDLAFSKRSCISRGRSLRLNSQLIYRLLKAPRNAAVVAVQHIYRIRPELLQHVTPRSDMILMRMRKNHIFQMVDAQVFDISQDKLRVIPVSRIDEHRFSLRYQQRGIRLSHI